MGLSNIGQAVKYALRVAQKTQFGLLARPLALVS